MRVVVMRGRIHLVTAEDCLVLRPLVQPVLDKELARHPDFGPPLEGVDLAPVLAYAHRLLAERPRTQAELRAAFAEGFPDLHPGALAYANRPLTLQRATSFCGCAIVGNRVGIKRQKRGWCS